ncbi:acyl-CoA synthetase [Salinicola sp. MH3R3-1]|uniref:DUF4387 domain-containing protein n=1 Tax=Salinicola sp. MH3R3-1 TaxID=1928762 RepID=UPI00094F374A|nr:DUF4387 domain-containing protein [Salinicola sp. MH3R3-1]OLO09332.1 acyl-CoA synthetase [Salinicola sp. MH3R3-1]
MALIKDIAQICKSKNAGPFYITIDVLFENPQTYARVKETGVLCAALFSRLYGVEEKDVLFTPYDTASAFKATLPRAIPAGDLGDTDVYGAQQHAPLLDVDIPISM